MTILGGEDADHLVEFPHTIYNKIKNHWYGNVAPASPVNGMIWVKDDGVASVYFGGWVEIGGVGDVTAAANLTDLAIVRGDGGAKGVKTSTALISDAGEMTNPSQPAFLAYNSVADANETGDGTFYTVEFDTEVYDQGGDFAANVFTAPVDGRYPFTAHVLMDGLDNDTYEFVKIVLVTSNRSYHVNYDSGLIASCYGGTMRSVQISVIADMDADDTAFIQVYVEGGAKQVNIWGHAAMVATYFSGALLC